MTSFTYEGDPDEVAPWLAFARSQQIRMAGLNSPGWNIQPEPDVLIMIRTTPPHIHIKVGGGNYHFIYRNLSLSENYYFKGFKPASGEELTDITTNKAKDAGPSDNALTVAAPLSDRHAWYGANNVTVLSGYGSLYASPRAPLSFMDKGAQFLGAVEIYNKGRKSYTAPFNAFNGAMFNQFLIGIQVNGDVEYITPGEDEFFTLPSVIGDLPDVAAATFEQTQIHRGIDQFNFYLNYEYDSHVMVDGFEEASCYWSFRRDGAKAVGVCYVNFAVDYLAYRWIDDVRHAGYDKTEAVVVPFLIELAFAESVDDDGNPILVMSLDQVTQMDWLSEGRMLFAADYNYYPPRGEAAKSYEPSENELVLAFMHRTMYEWKVYAEEAGDGVTPDNVTLSIASKTKEYISDTFNFNNQVAGLEHDPDVADWIDGQLETIDLRSMFYVVHEKRRSDYDTGDNGHRIVFRGSEAFSCKIEQAGAVQLDAKTPYMQLPHDDISEGNNSSSAWPIVKLGGKSAANPFDDNFFSYYRGTIDGDSYVIDVYCFYDEETAIFRAIYQYHMLSTSNDVDDQHCNASVWVI